MWVPWRVICHSESWQKGKEEVDELHVVDGDQEAASSLRRAKQLKVFGIRDFEAGGEHMGDSALLSDVGMSGKLLSI